MQSVASLIADPGVISLIPAQPHDFMEIESEIFSIVIVLLPLICCAVVSYRQKYVHRVLAYCVV